MDDIDYAHGDNGNKPPDGKDFQSGDPADPQEFDWYISRFVTKINEIITNHVNDGTGVHGLGPRDSVLGESDLTTHAKTTDAHHSRPSTTTDTSYNGGYYNELSSVGSGTYDVSSTDPVDGIDYVVNFDGGAEDTWNITVTFADGYSFSDSGNGNESGRFVTPAGTVNEIDFSVGNSNYDLTVDLHKPALRSHDHSI